MTNTIIQRRRHHLATYLLSLVSIVLVVSACTAEDNPNGRGGTTTTMPLAAPTITSHPASLIIKEGNTASLSVIIGTAPEGATLSYQWQTAAKGSTVFTNIAGATSDSYTTPVLAYADSGVQYRVKMTATLGTQTSSVTSGAAILSVLVVPKIVWTHTDGTKRYAYVPADGILLSSVLTNNRDDIRSVDTIPMGITTIGDEAFKACTSLTDSITLPNSVTSIGNSAFEGCSGLTSVTITNSVTSIEKYAFAYCSGLTSVTLPNSVNSIGQYAFAYCSGLTSVTIPNNLPRIEYRVFQGCSGLTSVTIPNSVTSIETYAFPDCRSLESITIPYSVEHIGSSAFDGCSSLASMIVEATTPPTAGTTMFDDTAPTLSITVPNASVDEYKAAKGWSKYANRITGY